MMSSVENEDHKVVPNSPTFAKLLDVNGQEIKLLNFTTNAYGSFAGEFILPSGGLTGIHAIQTKYGYTSFSVEEYKRPKFETTFNPVTQTYKINDNIKLTGTATAYAGSTITDAKVVYRVYRQVQYPRWCYWYPRNRSEEQEITHGETTTNDKGEYTITFAALPDKSVSKHNQPTFTYKVTADVTDINGETRSTTTYVNIGYHALIASVSIGSEIDKAVKEHSLSCLLYTS